MRSRLRWWITFPLFFVGLCGAQQPGCSLAISTPNSTVKVGEAVSLAIVITNTSDREIYYAGALNRPGGLYISVVDSNHKAVPETPEGQKRHGNSFPPVGSGSVLRIQIDPGKSMEEDVRIDKEWDISRPGRYTIHAEKSDPQSNTSVKSNAITLTVQ